jgi:hypothetical protein
MERGPSAKNTFAHLLISDSICCSCTKLVVINVFQVIVSRACLECEHQSDYLLSAEKSCGHKLTTVKNLELLSYRRKHVALELCTSCR